MCMKMFNENNLSLMNCYQQQDFLVNDMKKTGLSWYAYDFSVHSDVIAVDDVLDIVLDMFNDIK